MPKRPALLSTYALLFLGTPSRSRLARFRDRMVRRLVRHAGRRVPYHRDALARCGVDPGDVRGVDDLRRLPIMERTTLQTEPLERLLAEGVDERRLGTIWSSGSTGTRIATYRTRLETHLLNAVRLRAELSVGRRPGMRVASVSLIRSRLHERRSWWTALSRAIGFRDTRRIECRQEPEQVIEQLRADPPDMLGGFPGVLLRVADAVGPGGLADLGVSVLTAGGEVTTPAERERIGAAFGVRVHERYGSIEFSQIACQCPTSDLMHVCDESVVVEVIGDDGQPAGDGEAGEVVITGLHGYAMPLIRYRIGDVAIAGPPTCSCGAPFSTLRSVQGRVIDHLTMPDGRVVHPWTFTVPMHRANPWIARYRLTQERRDRLRLEVVPRDGRERTGLADVQSLCHDVLDPGVTIAVDLVDEILPEANGKYRVVRSLVDEGDEGSSR